MPVSQLSEPPSPNIRPKPMTQNAIDDTANTTKFLARMLTAFFAWHRPASSKAKPAFMKKTRKAVTITHRVSAATFNVAGSIRAPPLPSRRCGCEPRPRGR